MAAITAYTNDDLVTTEVSSTQVGIAIDPQYAYIVRHPARATTSGADELADVFISLKRYLNADGTKASDPTVGTTYVGANNNFILRAGSDVPIPPGNVGIFFKTAAATALVEIVRVPHYRGAF